MFVWRLSDELHRAMADRLGEMYRSTAAAATAAAAVSVSASDDVKAAAGAGSGNGCAHDDAAAGVPATHATHHIPQQVS
jgi:hypothetical protein